MYQKTINFVALAWKSLNARHFLLSEQHFLLLRGKWCPFRISPLISPYIGSFCKFFYKELLQIYIHIIIIIVVWIVSVINHLKK